ncbi:8bdc2195-0ba5-46a0-8b25-14ebd7f0ec92 [Thermothielavioides terrestris]|uniref:8bdc2195-0ba5-46a0-8b25-14ebd7f0ec92 n=1 Tax=Thermothielavioides terrestris TaxID=2587410 RepID=A0A3S4AUZ3_9PEZI|nr:8bdc2195-0ba5-46a0-8b25-14ebd7f0ec92 [Thermothielavioides terrestris]
MIQHRLRHLCLSFLFSIVLLGLSQRSLGLGSLPAGVAITEDTAGQVTINGDPTTGKNSTLDPQLPITATIFSGVPGPAACRGAVIFRVNLPPPPPSTPPAGAAPGTGPPTPEQCYDLPQAGGCGYFVASKDAGCEARLFAEPGCRVYLNTAVFVPEPRAVGGAWRSVGLRCGVPAPDPRRLGPPPLVMDGGDVSLSVRKRPGRRRRG